MEKIDFIGLGVQKAATSWIFQCLLEHPEIKVGKVKEANFFNFKYDFGYHWYHNLFNFGEWKTGEFSTLYFYDKNVPERIYNYRPDIKLILCLRNPVDRAYSQHQHEIRRGRISGELLNFDLALESNPSYFYQGLYAKHLNNFLNFFDKEQLFITFQEDIASNPDRVLENLYKFIGLNNKFKPEILNTKVNIARTYRSRNIDKSYRAIKSLFHKYLNEGTIRTIKKIGFHKLIERYNLKEQKPTEIPPMTLQTRKNLEAAYLLDIKELENILRRDLSSWYKNIN